MKKHTSILLVLIFLAVLAGGYYLTKPQPCGDCEILPSETDSAIVRPGFPYAESLPVTHVVKNDQHTISGILTLPDPCYFIEQSVLVKESFPEQVEITLTTQRRDELCATVVTDTPFEVSFQASEQAKVELILNGEAVELVEN